MRSKILIVSLLIAVAFTLHIQHDLSFDPSAPLSEQLNSLRVDAQKNTNLSASLGNQEFVSFLESRINN